VDDGLRSAPEEREKVRRMAMEEEVEGRQRRGVVGLRVVRRNRPAGESKQR
jgi:hypothetical protein